MERRSIVRWASVLVALMLTLSFATGSSYGQRKPKPRPISDETSFPIKPQKPECQQYTKFSECPLVGCGGQATTPGAKGAEQRLNTRKNQSSPDLAPAEPIEFERLRTKKVPAGYKYGITPARDMLTQAHEGDIVSTVAWLTDIRVGGQESCNCGLSKSYDTDNHMVLINDKVINTWRPAYWEKHSFTVEFTPRAKVGHPNFKVSVIKPLILAAPRGRLKVRITGLLMLDDFHITNPLPKGRQTNWEIHPVFKFEYCPYDLDSKLGKCELNGDTGWVNIDNQH